MKTVVVSGSFDDLRSRHIRLLEEAAKLGDVQVLLWSDALAGKPKFPLSERRYMVDAIRHVRGVRVVDEPLDLGGLKADLWASDATGRPPRVPPGIPSRVFTDQELSGFPEPAPRAAQAGRPKVIVTGCYDWFHSGHVRFCEEVAELGNLYVVVGNDANVAFLKGAGHPLFREEERRYVVGSVRHVTQCLISSGRGWMDAEPEVHRIKPDMYAVNEDGDKPEKRAFCEAHGLRYVILKRAPKAGLAGRSSTKLRGY